MPRARGKRTPVFVTIGPLKYGFQASANSESYRATLGHTAYTNQAGVFFGANSPKPNRAQLVTTSGSISSYCDPSKEDDLRAADWIITKYGRRRGIKTTGRVRTVFVAMPGGWNYGWNITADDVDLSADLKFEQASSSTTNLVFGVSYPKPPRATRRISGATHSSFIEPRTATINAAVAAGWSVSGVDYELLGTT